MLGNANEAKKLRVGNHRLSKDFFRLENATSNNNGHHWHFQVYPITLISWSAGKRYSLKTTKPMLPKGVRVLYGCNNSRRCVNAVSLFSSLKILFFSKKIKKKFNTENNEPILNYVRFDNSLELIFLCLSIYYGKIKAG